MNTDDEPTTDRHEVIDIDTQEAFVITSDYLDIHHVTQAEINTDRWRFKCWRKRERDSQ